MGAVVLKVSFCENNKGKTKVIKKLKEKYPDIEICIKDCIGKCHACAKVPIAKFNHKVIVGKDREDIHEKLVKKIEEK
jgi:uncharacterized protein YuzB (UPF0349 family)